MSLAESFARTGFAKFMNCTTGRIVRVGAGLALIVWALNLPGGGARMILLGIGLIPLTAGLFNLCFISALLGGPISGKEVAKSQRNS